MSVNVLVVDDDPAVNTSLVGYLEDFEFPTQSALSAEAALEMVKEHDFQLGIIDLRLPKMDGDELIIELHKLKPDMRFLIHTGSTEFVLTKDLKDVGIEQQHVLNKPLPDLHVIVDYITELV